jgi:hypothetical protein
MRKKLAVLLVFIMALAIAAPVLAANLISTETHYDAYCEHDYLPTHCCSSSAVQFSEDKWNELAQYAGMDMQWSEFISYVGIDEWNMAIQGILEYFEWNEFLQHVESQNVQHYHFQCIDSISSSIWVVQCCANQQPSSRTRHIYCGFQTTQGIRRCEVGRSVTEQYCRNCGTVRATCTGFTDGCGRIAILLSEELDCE